MKQGGSVASIAPHIPKLTKREDVGRGRDSVAVLPAAPLPTPAHSNVTPAAYS